MEVLQEATSITKKTFLSHVFSMSEESNAEVLNVIQYSTLGVLPIIVLNKSVQRLIPEADPDSSSIELLAEIFIQLVIMFVGIILIHRVITYIPTYSGFKYDNLNLTNVILAFLVIVLSIQTKLGLKVNILLDRALELWNGPTLEKKEGMKNKMKVSKPVSQHSPSQADYLDNSGMQNGLFPPAPVATTRQNSVMESYDNMMHTGGNGPVDMDPGPMAANGLLGGAFGSSF
jgi:hypothetical protein